MTRAEEGHHQLEGLLAGQDGLELGKRDAAQVLHSLNGEVVQDDALVAGQATSEEQTLDLQLRGSPVVHPGPIRLLLHAHPQRVALARLALAEAQFSGGEALGAHVALLGARFQARHAADLLVGYLLPAVRAQHQQHRRRRVVLWAHGRRSSVVHAGRRADDDQLVGWPVASGPAHEDGLPPHLHPQLHVALKTLGALLAPALGRIGDICSTRLALLEYALRLEGVHGARDWDEHHADHFPPAALRLLGQLPVALPLGPTALVQLMHQLQVDPFRHHSFELLGQMGRRPLEKTNAVRDLLRHAGANTLGDVKLAQRECELAHLCFFFFTDHSLTSSLKSNSTDSTTRLVTP